MKNGQDPNVFTLSAREMLGEDEMLMPMVYFMCKVQYLRHHFRPDRMCGCLNVESSPPCSSSALSSFFFRFLSASFSMSRKTLNQSSVVLQVSERHCSPDEDSMAKQSFSGCCMPDQLPRSTGQVSRLSHQRQREACGHHLHPVSCQFSICCTLTGTC